MFLSAVGLTAEIMEQNGFNGKDAESTKAVCAKYPQIVAGFMQAIAASEETKESLETIERSIGDIRL